MGGEGSGRKPSVETIIKQSSETITPLGDGLFLPNYSGVQDVALKTHAPLSVGGVETDPVFNAWLIATPPLYSETDPVFMTLSGTLPYLSSETDPIFMSLSGTLPYLSNASLFATSGSATVSLGTHAADATIHYVNPGFLTSESLATALSGTVANLSGSFTSLSGSYWTLSSNYSGHIADTTIHYVNPGFITTETDPIFMSLSGTLNYASSAGLTALSGSHANLSGSFNSLSGSYWTLSSTVSNLSGTYNTHAGDSSDPHGATLTQTNLLLTSGTVTVDLTASGSALIRNFLIGTELSGSLVASNYPQGTIYLKYT